MNHRKNGEPERQHTEHNSQNEIHRGERRWQTVATFPAKYISFESHELHTKLENVVMETFLNSRSATYTSDITGKKTKPQLS